MRGSIIFDLIIIAVVFVVIGLTVITANLVMNEVQTGFVDANFPTIATNATNNIILAQNSFDSIYIFLLFASIMAVVISAVYIQTNPIFFIASFIFLMVLMVIAPILSNTFLDFAESSQLVTYANNYPMMIYIMQNWPAILLVSATVIIIFLYSRIIGRGGSSGY